MAFSVYDTQSKKVRSVYFLLDDPKGGKLSSEKFEKWDSSSQPGECIYYYLAQGKYVGIVNYLNFTKKTL